MGNGDAATSSLASPQITRLFLLLLLFPQLQKKWTPEKERSLAEAHVELGNKWALIATRIPGNHRDDEVKVRSQAEPLYLPVKIRWLSPLLAAYIRSHMGHTLVGLNLHSCLLCSARPRWLYTTTLGPGCCTCLIS